MIAAVGCAALLSFGAGCETVSHGGGHIRALSATVSPGNRVSLIEPTVAPAFETDAPELRPTDEGFVTVTISCQPMMATSMPARSTRRYFSIDNSARADAAFAMASPAVTPFMSTVSPARRDLPGRWSAPVTSDVIVQADERTQPIDQSKKLESAETASVPVAP
jgi:hypothetical protein